MGKRTLGAVVVAGCAVVVLAAPAGGHALLRSSSPEAGERVADPPRAVSLTFTEPPEPTLSSVRVLDASGRARQQGEPRVAPEDEFTLEVALDDVAEGVYTVTWRTVSKADGHATAGSFAFGVGVQPSGGGGRRRWLQSRARRRPSSKSPDASCSLQESSSRSARARSVPSSPEVEPSRSCPKS